MNKKIQYSKEVLAAIEKIESEIVIRKELREELSKKENEAKEAMLVWKGAVKACVNLKESTLPPLLSEFNIGDKVLVKNGKKDSGMFSPWYDAEGIVSRVKVDIRSNGEVEFQYLVNALKKNGTQSKNALHYLRHEYDVSQLVMIKKTQ